MTTLEPVIVRFENEMAKCDGQKEKGKIFNLQDIGADLGASLNEDGKPRDKYVGTSNFRYILFLNVKIAFFMHT